MSVMMMMIEKMYSVVTKSAKMLHQRSNNVRNDKNNCSNKSNVLLEIISVM